MHTNNNYELSRCETSLNFSLQLVLRANLLVYITHV